MAKRMRIVVVYLAVAVGVSGGIAGPPAHAGSTRIDWNVAGTIAFVRLAFVDSAGVYRQPDGILVDAEVNGPPGNARFKVVGIPGAFTPVPTEECGNHFRLSYAFDDFVAVFSNQSMMFATLVDGWVCVFNPGAAEPLPPAVFHLEITGGKGAYEGARGEFVGTFRGFPLGPNGSGALLAETGTITGWVDR